jgi:hypothetical protein
MTRLRWKPADARRRWCSRSVRSRPPAFHTSMSKSSSLLNEASLPGGMSGSMSSRRPVSDMAVRQFREDALCALVIPVMDDFLEQVAISSGWHRCEEIASHEFPPGRLPCALHACASRCDHVRQIKEHATRLGVSVENRRQEGALPATDVHHGVGCSEIIGGDDRRVLLAAPTRHRVIKDPCGFWMCWEILKQWDAEDIVECGLPRTDTVEHALPRAPVLWRSQHESKSAQRTGRVRAQGLCQ